jgi:hypothetical protein
MTLTSDKRVKFTQDYNIFNNMKCPSLMGDLEGTPYADGTWELKSSTAVTSVANNLFNYAASYPVSGYSTKSTPGRTVNTARGPYYLGPDYAMGSNYFVPIGKCAAGSEDMCEGKTRWVYLRNIPTGKIPLLGNVRFKDVVGCDIEGLTEGRGLIPGILEDLSDIQPFNMIDNIQGKGNFGDMKCTKVELPVGAHIYDPQMQCKDPTFKTCDRSSWWLEERCSPSSKYTKEVTYGVPDIPGARPLGYSEPAVQEAFAGGQAGQACRGARRSRRSRLSLGLALLLLLLIVAVATVFSSALPPPPKQWR